MLNIPFLNVILYDRVYYFRTESTKTIIKNIKGGILDYDGKNTLCSRIGNLSCCYATKIRQRMYGSRLCRCSGRRYCR